MGNTMDRRMSNEAVNAEANALATLANNGYIRIYSGTRPATPNDGLAGNTLLAELRFGATAFGAAVNGVITANAITEEDAALAGGTASWARILQSNGTTALWDDEVGTATANITMNSITIGAGAIVSISSMTHTVPKS
jgi:hypothetical protein